MLASVAAALVVGGSVLFLIWIGLLPDYEENRLIAVGTVSSLGLIYVLSRTRYYQGGAALLIASIFLLVIAIILTAPGNSVEQMQTLYFLILAIMFAYFFFGRFVNAAVILLALGVIAWFFATRTVSPPLIYAFLVFFLITALLGAVFTVLNHGYRAHLLQSEERYRLVISALSEGIIVHAPDGSILTSNDAAASILGLTTDQLHGKDSFDPQWRSIHEDGSPFPPEEHPVMVTLRTGEELSNVVMGVHQPNGVLRWISISSRMLKETPGAVVSFADITETRQAETILSQFVADMRALQLLHLDLSEVQDLDELLRQMIQQSQQRLGLERVGLLLLSDDGQHLLGTYGVDPNGVLRDERYYTERITDDHWTLPILETPNHVQLQENVTLFDDGHAVGTGWAAQSALWNGKRAIGYLVIDNFVTQRPPRLYERELLSILGSTFGHLIERKRSELALVESEQRQRALLTALPDLVLRLNADGVYLDLHAPNDSDLVAPRDQIIGRRIDQLLPPDVSERVLRALDRVMQTGEEQLIEYSLEIGGVVKDYEARMVAAQSGEALTVVRNVTERNRVLTALRESEERFSAAFRHSPVPMVISTAEGRASRYVDANQAYLDLVGYSWEELKGRVMSETGVVIDDVEREDRLDVLERYRIFDSRHARLRNRHGEVREVILSAQRMRMGAGEYDVEIMLDVTEQRRAQQREFDLALEKERVRLLQQFIEKASHEFRTPLAIVNSSAYLMMRMQDASRREERAAIIQQQVKRLMKMIDMLFLLARLESGTKPTLVPMDITLTVRNVCHAVSIEHHESPPLALTIEEGVPVVRAHSQLLQDALIQILDNAYRFTPSNGAITVRVFCNLQTICIEIIDTGTGIHPDHLPHIFDTFWQANMTDSAAGMGIGLSIVRRVVDLHGGRVEVSSTLGEGTTLRVLLPVPSSDAG